MREAIGQALDRTNSSRDLISKLKGIIRAAEAGHLAPEQDKPQSRTSPRKREERARAARPETRAAGAERPPRGRPDQKSKARKRA